MTTAKGTGAIPYKIFQEVGKAFEIRPLLPMLLSGKVNRMALVEEERAKQGSRGPWGEKSDRRGP